eukprot:XP_001703485.1 predicted protein [Chlamydomonas reinhardtii]
MSQITRNVSIGRAARREMDVASSSYGESAGQLLEDGTFRRPSRNSAGGMAGSAPGLPNGHSAHSGSGAANGGQRSAGATATGVAAFFGPLGGLIGLSSPPPAASAAARARASASGAVASGGQGPQGGSGSQGGAAGPGSGLQQSQQLASSFSTTSSACVGSCYDAELARQRAAVAAIEDDVEEECRVNRELAARITERLDNSCKCAASVEECCEWAIAIREAIAVAEGKQLAFEEEEQQAGQR